MVYNLDRINKSTLDRNIQTPWVEIIKNIFNPADIPSPILLRPIVDDVISNADIDIIYPDKWLNDFLEHIYTISDIYGLHIFSRAYERRGVKIRIYDLLAESWIVFDIQVYIYQLKSRRKYITWDLLAPRAISWHDILEPDSISGALLYLLHLVVQRKDIDSESVKARSRIFLDRLETINEQNSSESDLLKKILADRSLLKDRDYLNLLKKITAIYLAPHTKQHDSVISRRIQKKIGKFFLFTTTKLFFVGADGTGKSTLMEHLCSKTKIIQNLSTYNGNIIYNNAKRLARRLGPGVQASDIYPRYFFIISLAKTLFLTLIHIRKIIFFDRSPTDILITRRKTDDISPCPNAERLQTFTAGLFTIHVIGYNTEQFDNPKEEMTLKQISIYNTLMYNLSSQCRPLNYLLFKNSSPVGKSVSVLKKILTEGGVKAFEDI